MNTIVSAQSVPLRKTDNDCSIVDGDDNIAPKDWDFYDPENIKLIL